MPMLTRDQILAAQDLQVTRVPVPEWGDGAEVCVRVMTGREFDTFNARIAALAVGEAFNQRAYVCALTMCDEQGGRLFDVQEVDALADKNAVALDRVYEASCSLNLLREVDREAAKKNASASPPDASGLPSPDFSADDRSENGNSV